MQPRLRRLIPAKSFPFPFPFPEPSTWIGGALGLAMLGLMQRRRILKKLRVDG
jgi:hypothetical protein